MDMPSLILSDQVFDKWIPGTDTSVLTLGTQEPDSVVTNCTISANGAEWALKCPGNTGSIIRGSRISGGKERALDVVRGGNLHFEDCEFHSGYPHDRSTTKSRWSLAKTCDIGIKGGATDIAFTRCSMSDLLLGDHSIYDNPNGVGPRTTGIVLTDCKNPAGGSIVIRAWNADLPQLVNTQAIALKWNGLVMRVYFWVAGKWIDSRMPVA